MSEGALVLGVGAAAGLGGAPCKRFAREGLELDLRPYKETF